MALWTRLKSVGWDRLLTNLKDYHIPVLVFIFLVGVAITVLKPASMTMTFVYYTGLIVGGITGQAFSPYPRDKDASSSTDSKGGDGLPQ